MSQFAFLEREWPAVFDAATMAERFVHGDPRTACFYSRRALELAVNWAFKHDESLRLPYQDNLSALIHDPSFKLVAGEAVFGKARVIKTLGNRAVHSRKKVLYADGLVAVQELFHIAYWFARTYARVKRPPPGLAFDPEKVSCTAKPNQDSVIQLRTLSEQLRERDEKLAALFADKGALDEELQRLRAEVSEAKKAAASQPDTHNYSEGETRDFFIDLMLAEAGWPLDQDCDREFEVTGMPNKSGKGFVDYVLWGDDGKPLGLVEAKRTRRDARVGQQQAKLYANCLERQFGQRPIIFYSNGYEHWVWDDIQYPPRQVQGFLNKAELELLILRRETRVSLAEAPINSEIVGRHYQTRAVRRVAEAFERDHDRKALIVMATGAGKTRTVIALSDLLIRCNWVKRVLFLSDRVALVKQAVNAFKRHMPDCSPVNLVSEKEVEGRVFVSTYQTIMGLIDEPSDGQRRFGVGHFDLVIIDESHRSVFRKYRAIFDYFDSLLVGLTATPKAEVSRNTYALFDLEDGVPTDAYSLEEAVRDGFLVPPKAVSVPLRFQSHGIRYDELTEDEKDQWDALEWSEEGTIPDRVGADAVNKWLFNEDTVDKVLAHLMTRSLKVAGGDRLGKTIMFAKNQAHAEFITERFNANYPHYRGEFARVITFKTEYAQSLIESFSTQNKDPHLAISVDMLDTGIDIPEVVNLAIFKPVRSKTKFWQMLGRGTRLCPDLFGPGQDKELFYVFDYCGNLEYFSQDIPATDGSATDSLSKKLFEARLMLVCELDNFQSDLEAATVRQNPLVGAPRTLREVRDSVAAMLRHEISAMNTGSVEVRPHRRLVEKYKNPGAWAKLSSEAISDLAVGLAGLPAAIDQEDEQAKRFDLLVLNLQLALLRSDSTFDRLRDRAKQIIGLLEQKSTIPIVSTRMTLIRQAQTNEWWQDVTVPTLEGMRRKLRALVRLIDERRRAPVYTNFEDLMGGEIAVEFENLSEATDFEKFRSKARAFLRQHLDHVSIHKLRSNMPLTVSDLSQLERLLAQTGIGDSNEIRRAADDSHGLGLFVRSLVGMDRRAASEAMGSFLAGKSLDANQIEFIDLIVTHLTEHGTVGTERLYESPFTDISPKGPDGLFSAPDLSELLCLLDTIRATAVAA